MRLTIGLHWCVVLAPRPTLDATRENATSFGGTFAWGSHIIQFMDILEYLSEHHYIVKITGWDLFFGQFPWHIDEPSRIRQLCQDGSELRQLHWDLQLDLQLECCILIGAGSGPPRSAFASEQNAVP